MTELTTREELLRAGLDLVRASGMTTVLPDFTVRELTDRAGGPTRSAFHHAWPQRCDFDHEVLEEVLAERAASAPLSLTSVPRFLDLMDSGPDLPMMARSAYLNVGGPPQRRDLRDRLSVICLAASDDPLAKFAVQSEQTRYAKADDLMVQVLRIAGLSFGLQPDERFTFLDPARAIVALSDGMLMHRIANPHGKFDDHVIWGTPGWSLESVMAYALMKFMTNPIGTELTVPVARKSHPVAASRTAAELPRPQRPLTTRSTLVDAAVDIVKERGLFCTLPSFTVPEVLEAAESNLTEGAFHHIWPRKIDFERELMAELAVPDTDRFAANAVGWGRDSNMHVHEPDTVLHLAAAAAMSSVVDQNYLYLATLVESGHVDDRVRDALARNFSVRSEVSVRAVREFGNFVGVKPVDGLGWQQIAWISMAMTDGLLIRGLCDSAANHLSLECADPVAIPSLLGFVYCTMFSELTEPL